MTELNSGEEQNIVGDWTKCWRVVNGLLTPPPPPIPAPRPPFMFPGRFPLICVHPMSALHHCQTSAGLVAWIY